MNKRNYNRELEQFMLKDELKGAHLFLHSCCAPCSSAVLERLRTFFRITVFYYNPNIFPETEYTFRKEEEKKLVAWFNALSDVETNEAYAIEMVDADYEPKLFLDAVKGLEQEPEGGARCEKCFALRLSKTVAEAIRHEADYVTTTLTISPLKNAELINQIGEELCAQKGVCWLPSDFKKKDGYKRSITLSKELGLYRQNFCGCPFSIPGCEP